MHPQRSTSGIESQLSRITLSAASSRREFLSAVAGGAAAGSGLVAASKLAAGAESASSNSTPWKMRLSTSSSHFHRLPFEQACERIGKLGFDAIDIWSAHIGRPNPRNCIHLYEVARRLGPKGLKEVLAKNKLKLFSFSVYGQGTYPRFAELLGESGGGIAIRGSAGGSTEPGQPKELTKRMRMFFEELKPEIELAGKYNTRLAIENHGNALLHTLDSFKAFVDLNPSPHVGIALAPYHLQTIDASVPEAIQTCGKQLLFFYAWQHAGQGETGQLPGHGPTDFVPWIAALAKARYAYYVNPFMHGDVDPDAMSTALGKARDYLKTCHAKAVARG